MFWRTELETKIELTAMIIFLNLSIAKGIDLFSDQDINDKTLSKYYTNLARRARPNSLDEILGRAYLAQRARLERQRRLN